MICPALGANWKHIFEQDVPDVSTLVAWSKVFLTTL